MLKFQENVPLAPLTTLKVGGPARFFVMATSVDDLIAAVEFARERGLNLFFLGGGSNILVSDKGFDGLVVKIGLKGLAERGYLITAQAGEDWDQFVAGCVENDLAGVECLSGIPGSIGGTPVQNVGAYGQEVSETIVSVECLDLRSLEIVELSNEACGFSYRTSIFNTTMRDRYVVLSVTFCLEPGGPAKIVYKDLLDHFAGKQATLSDVRQAVLSIRRAKSMVIDPTDPNSKSAGSFFKNPVVSREKLKQIEESVGNGIVPHFLFGEMVKIPAAWLIERAGFHKGFVLGNVGLSSNHTLALINRGGATAGEILGLKEVIVDEVVSKFGIELEPEPIFIGS